MIVPSGVVIGPSKLVARIGWLSLVVVGSSGLVVVPDGVRRSIPGNGRCGRVALSGAAMCSLLSKVKFLLGDFALRHVQEILEVPGFSISKTFNKFVG